MLEGKGELARHHSLLKEETSSSAAFRDPIIENSLSDATTSLRNTRRNREFSCGRLLLSGCASCCANTSRHPAASARSSPDQNRSSLLQNRHSPRVKEPPCPAGKGVEAEPLLEAPVFPCHLCPLSHPKHWTHSSCRRTARGP